MCELMGLCYERPISAQISMRAFGLRCEENADGWGLAWYPDRSAAVVKEPIRWDTSAYTRFLGSYDRLRSSVYLAHVRHRTTGGEPTHGDTHPFVREFGGRDYCFAHNGTLEDIGTALPLDRFQPVGNTDSEHLFCWLLDCLATRQNLMQSEQEWHDVQSLLQQANDRGRLNCLLTDGERLLAYRDLKRWKGLSYRVRPGQSEDGSLEDQTLKVELERTPARGVVVATWPLNDQTWHVLLPGELLVVDRGQIVWPKERKLSAAPRAAALAS